MQSRLSFQLRTRPQFHVAVVAISLALWAFSFTARAQSQGGTGDLTQLKIEDLMNLEITSASRQKQTLSTTPAAVFVITQEDIHRSGSTNIPDLLRMVPGLNVAQINANSWAISSRGLNDLFSNELLVLVDGRTVYAPSSGGVFWDTVDLPLEDIERIEVIRGPGGSVWGTNAVNGVINIVTKSAEATRGGLVVAGGGGFHRAFATVQYGSSLGKKSDYRVYVKYLDEASLQSPEGRSLGDGWHSLRGGFRLDSALTAKDGVTLQGDLYTSREGSATSYLPSITSPAPVNFWEEITVAGGFLQGAWSHKISDRSATQLTISFDQSERNDTLGETRHTLDADFQHNFRLGRFHSMVWGLDYRYTDYSSVGSLFVSFNPASASHTQYSGFIQDEITLLPDRLYFTVGTKLEHHYYTGLAVMPTARLAWTPSTHTTFWAAVSLAERTPAELDTVFRGNVGSFSTPDGALNLISVFGNPDLKNEGLLAYEAGYRAELSKHISVDLAAYYNRYDHQMTDEPGVPFVETSPVPVHVVLPIVYGNLMHGETHGVEFFADWRATSRWVLSPGYAFEQIHMHVEPSSHATSAGDDGTTPVNAAQLRSHLVLPASLSWDVSAFYSGRLVDLAVPSYTRLDTQLNWQWKENVTLSVVGQNLLREGQLQFIDAHGVARSSLMPRSAFAKFTWRF